MNKGTIILNKVAGPQNPHRHFIYTHSDYTYIHGVAYSQGKLHKIKIYKQDFRDSEKFEVVGYSKGFDILKNDLIFFNDKKEEPYFVKLNRLKRH